MKTLAVDIETYSSVDIKDSGVYAYAEAPDFEILIIAYRLDDGETEVFELPHSCENPGIYVNMLYPDFWEALTDPEVIKTAFNANFERTCLSRYFSRPMPPEEWRCTMVRAVTLGLPRSLADVGAALGIPQDKQKDSVGKSLIAYFSKPCKPTKTNGGRTRNRSSDDPEKWKLFMEYCRQDVVAEQAILEKIKMYEIPESEQRLWCFDQRMNDRGVLLDIPFINGIIEYDEMNQEQLKEEAKEITGLSNPNSLAQLKKWIFDNFGINVSSITKDNIDELKEQLAGYPDAVRMLEIRQALGKTSTKKYSAMINSVCSDNRLRGVLQFYGASRTGRWAGRIVQVHNLPQNKIADIELARELVAEQRFSEVELLFGETPFVFSQLIRTAFVASECCRFVISDFSAIEARVIAWLAGEQWRLDVFNTHGKIYEASASQMFHVPIENIKKGSKLRQQGKIAELALGYQGAFGAIKAMDKEGSIPDEEIPLLVHNWRQANPAIVKFWNTVENAAKTAISEHRTVKIQHGITFSHINGILFIKLPSGRKLAYYDSRLEDHNGKESITYAGVEQNKKKWGRLETYGGKLVENIVQAVARDCLAEAMLRVDKLGFKIVMHVHDEMIVDVPKEFPPKAIDDMMKMPISWAPGLPLKGDTYETAFYRKD